ncbi:MAG: cobalamin-binding protein [Planctomycetaceae bacterium]|nr:cobalamin-binding protein [Planctomycetaceae bacterium]
MNTTPRIVSLIASATEIVAALGFGEELVGRSHECDWPHDVTRLPMCSAPRIDVHGSSREIDDRVKDALRDAVSVYRVDAQMLDELRPTHIITQTQCEVCAVSLKDVEAAVCDLVSSRPQIVSLAPMCLADVWDDIRRVADALGAPARGSELVADLQRRLAVVVDVAQRQARRPRIACIEWIDPLMCAGNWVPELVELAGGRDILGTPGQHSPYISLADVAAADPDVIAVMPCGFDIARTRAEMPALQQNPAWRALRAVQAGRVYLTDGNQYFNRPGPRMVESAEILAELLHPEAFPPRHRGTGWRCETAIA